MDSEIPKKVDPPTPGLVAEGSQAPMGGWVGSAGRAATRPHSSGTEAGLPQAPRELGQAIPPSGESSQEMGGGDRLGRREAWGKARHLPAGTNPVAGGTHTQARTRVLTVLTATRSSSAQLTPARSPGLLGARPALLGV